MPDLKISQLNAVIEAEAADELPMARAATTNKLTMTQIQAFAQDGVVLEGAPAGSGGGALDGTYPDPDLKTSVAGNGLGLAANVLSVNVDGTTIEITADALNVKSGTFQPLDATLTALAASNWAANAIPIGTGADTLSQTSFAANTFPARASSGNLVAKTITDFGLSLVDDATNSDARTTLGLGTIATQAANNVSITGGSITGITDLAIADGGTGASTAGAAATNLGLGTGDTPTFTGINVNNTDTTITRSGAGDIAVEGNVVYRAGGTDVPVADGGTGASTAAAAATNLGLGTGDSPQFTAVNVGAATDTTLTRSAAGVLAVEGAIISAWTTVTKTIDESVSNNSTLQDDDELFFTATSTAVYEIEAVIIYASPAGGGTPDLKFAMNEDATVRGAWWGIGLGTANAALDAGFNTSDGASTWGTDTTKRIIKIIGGHVGGGGTLKVRWAQNTSGGNATIVYAGSVLRYRRLL